MKRLRPAILILFTAKCLGATFDPVYLASLSSEPSLQEIATDVSTPSTSQRVIAADEIGVRIWTGETPFTEPYFILSYQRDSEPTESILTTRSASRILHATPGQAVKFATSDGRPLWITAVKSGVTNLTAPAWSTNTVYADRAGPPYWQPTRHHIALRSAQSQYKILPTGDETRVFIKELSPQGWTPERWIRLESSNAVTLRATYRRIALANYDGTQLQVAVPAGSYAGGTSHWQRVSDTTEFPTTVSVSNAVGFLSAVAAATNGTQIVLASGTYSINALRATNFASNGQSMANIMIRSESGNPDDVTIVATNGIAMTSYAYTTNAGVWRDVTFGNAGATNQVSTFNTPNGAWTFDNVDFRLGGFNAVDNAIAIAGPATSSPPVKLAWVRVHHSGADAFNFFTTTNVIMFGCFGTNANGQIVTHHNSGRVAVYGGSFSNATQQIVSGDTDNTRHFLFYSTIAGPSSGLSTLLGFGATMFGVNTPASGLIMNAIYAVCSSITGLTTSGKADTNRLTLVANRFVQTTGSQIDVRRGHHEFIANIFQVASGIRAQFYTGTTNNDFDLINNTGLSGGTWLALATPTPPARLINNATTNYTSGISVGAGYLFGTNENNTLDPTTPGYVAGTGDITNANVQLDERFFPAPGGNADGNGTANAVSWVGGFDYWSLPLKYATNRMSRGARERPAWYGGTIIPDSW